VLVAVRLDDDGAATEVGWVPVIESVEQFREGMRGTGERTGVALVVGRVEEIERVEAEHRGAGRFEADDRDAGPGGRGQLPDEVLDPGPRCVALPGREPRQTATGPLAGERHRVSGIG